MSRQAFSDVQLSLLHLPKVSGGPYSAVVIVLEKALRFTRGSLRYHKTSPISNLGVQKRGFCADCGSRLTGGQMGDSSHVVGIAASSVDDPAVYKPQQNIFVSHAQAWDVLDPKLPTSDLYPASPTKIPKSHD